MPVDHSFGGGWTIEKIECLRKYIAAYMRLFSANENAKFLIPHYVDAFAGTGYITRPAKGSPDQGFLPDIDDCDAHTIRKGSARVALEVDPPFRKYVFIDKNPRHHTGLVELVDEFPAVKDRTRVVCDEANAFLQLWSKGLRHLDRAVVFLDPYGMQVEWATLEALARTEKVDLWLLFPLSMGVLRLLRRCEPPPEPWARSLTRAMGTEEWKKRFYQPTGQGHLAFGDGEEEDVELTANVDAVGAFFRERLETIFARVAPKSRILYNSKNSPLYMLCFASGNPKGSTTAVQIADNILGKI